MSDDQLAVFLTVALLALMLAWVPFLELLCPACSRFLARRRARLPQGATVTHAQRRHAKVA